MTVPEIVPRESVEAAATFLARASADQPVDLIIGNKIKPVPIVDWLTFSRSLREVNPRLSVGEISARYWRFLEFYRLLTRNSAPHINYLCVAQLCRDGRVSSVATTNYDQFLQSIGERDTGFRFILNPCQTPADSRWDNDGYYRATMMRARYRAGRWQIPLWKIHGDLGYVMCSPCGHRFRLPRFVVGPPATGDDRQRYLDAGMIGRHDIILRSSGNVYDYDASLTRGHRVDSIQHHLDFGTDRYMFALEGAACRRSILRGANTKTALFVIGLSTREDNPEDIVPTVLEAAKTIPIVYIMPGTEEIGPRQSMLISRLEEMGADYFVITEITDQARLEFALLTLMETAGYTDLLEEYENWRSSVRWWKDIVDPE